MFWYLATPYSKFHLGIKQAFRDACQETALLIRAGIPTFSPIAHTHPIAIYGGIDPFAHDIWLPADEPLMNAAHGLIVCKMQGWDESYGVRVEIARFEAVNKPVIFMTPGEIPAELEK